MYEMEFSDDRSECRNNAADMNRALFSNVRCGIPSAYGNQSASECQQYATQATASPHAADAGGSGNSNFMTADTSNNMTYWNMLLLL
jgi:hypothetical protein